MIQGAAAGDAADRAVFARRYQPVIRAYLGARWRGTPLIAEIDDATQDAFVACFKDGGALARVDPSAPGRFRSFLYGVVLNVSRRIEAKRGRRREEQPESEFDAPATGDGVSVLFDRAWASALLKRAARLQAQRADSTDARRRIELMQLRFGEGLPIRDIAKRWNAEAPLIHRAYARAREEFKRALQDVIREEEGDQFRDVDAECERLISYFG